VKPKDLLPFCFAFDLVLACSLDVNKTLNQSMPRLAQHDLAGAS
jgi:hypothetical protein